MDYNILFLVHWIIVNWYIINTATKLSPVCILFYQSHQFGRKLWYTILEIWTINKPYTSKHSTTYHDKSLNYICRSRFHWPFHTYIHVRVLVNYHGKFLLSYLKSEWQALQFRVLKIGSQTLSRDQCHNRALINLNV